MANFNKRYLESLLKQLKTNNEVLKTLEAIEKMEIPFAIAKELHVRDIVRGHTSEQAVRKLVRSILNKLLASKEAAKKKNAETLTAEEVKIRCAEKAASKQQKANDGTGCKAIKDVPALASFDKSNLVRLLEKLDDDENVLETLEAIDKLEIPIPIAEELHVGAVVRRHVVQVANRKLCRSIFSKLVANEEAAKKKGNAASKAEQAKMVRDKRAASRKEKNAVVKEVKIRKRKMEMDLNANNTYKYEEKAAVPEKKKKNTVA